jgi:hypothetical protein
MTNKNNIINKTQEAIGVKIQTHQKLEKFNDYLSVDTLLKYIIFCIPIDCIYKFSNTSDNGTWHQGTKSKYA